VELRAQRAQISQGNGSEAAGALWTDRARRSVQRRLSHFGAVLESLADGVVVADLEGRLIFSNKAAAQIVGIGVLDVPPEEWTEAYGCFLPGEVTPYPPDQLPLALAMRGEEVREAEVLIRNNKLPHGVLLSINATPLRDEAGEIQGGVIAFRDITEKKRTSELVERLSNAVGQTADSVIITKRDGTIEYVNPAFEQSTGYTREEALGKTPSILKSGTHDASVYEELWSTVIAGGTFRGTLLNRRKCGELYHSENTITPMKDAAGNITHMVSVAKDITESLKREEQEYELRLARMVQQRLYPAASPRVQGFDIAGATFPAGEMCGDYFDYIPMTRDRLGIVIGDVSGHGLGPSLLMAETRAYLRSYCRTLSNIGGILDLLNETLVDDTESNTFVTLIFGCLDPAERTLTYVNAGHPPGFILDRSGEVREALKSTDVPAGLFPNHTFDSGQTVALKPGDLVLFLTDGITESEAPDGTCFGARGALEVVRTYRQESSEQIVERLCQAALDFAQGQPQNDDITAVVFKLDAAT